ncbi:MAG: hypothetical protein JWL80_477 [Parcubacteria group bacterium]|nr:hypothetical protein [Parcubacteria group bacterium]
MWKKKLLILQILYREPNQEASGQEIARQVNGEIPKRLFDAYLYSLEAEKYILCNLKSSSLPGPEECVYKLTSLGEKHFKKALKIYEPSFIDRFFRRS